MPSAQRALTELVGNLDQDPRAVAGVVLAAAGAAVVQVAQRRQAVADELVRLAPLEVDDEADAAAVVLVSGVVEALGDGSLYPWMSFRDGSMIRTTLEC